MGLVDKSAIIAEFGRGDNDTGAVEVQVALLTARIGHITEHLKVHKKDKHSRHGLENLVGSRYRFLKYLARINVDRYKSLVHRLGLRK